MDTMNERKKERERERETSSISALKLKPRQHKTYITLLILLYSVLNRELRHKLKEEK